jgi:N-formylmaleamate deformylase
MAGDPARQDQRGAAPQGAAAEPLDCYLDVAGTRLHYLDYGGTGEPLLLIPGITMPAKTWEFVSLRLAERCRVLAVDLRGRGLSDRGRPGDHTLPTYAGDVAAIIAAEGLDRPAILGHSLGARVATALGVLHPQARGPVVVADPPLSGPGRGPYPTPLSEFLQALRAARAGTAVAEIAARYPSWSSEQVEARAVWLSTCDETAVSESYANFSREDFWSYWAALAPPATLIYGAESPDFGDLGQIDELARANPVVPIRAIPGAGHMIPFDNMPDFLSAVFDCLDRSGTAAGGAASSHD